MAAAPSPRRSTRPALVVLVAVVALLGLVAGCGSSDGSSAGTSPTTDTPGTAAKRSVVDRTLPPSACPAPTTPPRQATTTALAGPNQWPPLGYDRTALVRVDVLSWNGGNAMVRWQPGQGVDVCTASLDAPEAWVLDSNGYQRLEGDAIGAFITQRKAELGATADGVPFLVEVSDDGTQALQLGEIPPG